MTTWREHDARLVPAAALVWTATAMGELGVVGALRWLAAGAVGAIVVLLLWRPPIASATRWLVVLSLLAGAATAAVSTARAEQRESALLTTAAVADGHVRIEGTTAARPRLIGNDGRRVVVEVSVERTVYRQSTDASPVRAVVIGSHDRWHDVLLGARVSVTGTAHVPSGRSSAVALLIDSGTSDLSTHAPRWSLLAEHVRAGLADAATVNDGDLAGLLVALVNGDTSDISDITTEEFRRSGLAHLLAVSGANVAIVTGAVLWLLRLLGVPFALQVAGASVALIAFVLITGPEPSVLRAAGMGVVMLIALASGRPRSAIPALCTAIIVLLWAVPELSVSVGFILSVLATAGVVVLGAHWTTLLKERMPTWLAAAIAVAAAAGLATLPVIVLLLPMVNLTSVLANIVAAPAVPIATVCGVAAAVFAPIFFPLAQLLCWFAGHCVSWIALIARVAARPSPFQIPLPMGVLAAGIVLASIAVLVLLVRVSRDRPLARTSLCAALAGAILLSVPVRWIIAPKTSDDWIFAACDVGQGDATLARAGPRAAVVLDTGPEPGLLDDCLAQLGVSEVPALLLTHFHDDHVAGTSAVLGRREVGTVVLGTYDGGPAEQAVRRLAGGYDVPVIEVEAGWQVDLGDVHLEVVAPAEPIIGTSSDANNNSLVVRVTVRGVTMLITGDLQQEAMAELVGCGCLHTDVLTVPHHGSANRDDRFFAQTAARLALVSAGADNDYGHPAPSTISMLERLGMTVRRTDLHGTVLVLLTDEGQLALLQTR